MKLSLFCRCSKKCVIFVGILFVFFQPALSRSPSLPNAAQTLTTSLMQLKTYTALFKQKTYDRSGEVIETATGRIMMARPHYFRWEIRKPNEQLLISTEKRFWFYDKNLSQVLTQPLNKTIFSPALVFSDSAAELQKKFSITWKQYPIVFLLTPRQPNSAFQWVQIVLKKNTLVGMKTLNRLGEITLFEFSDIQVNHPLSLKSFKFSPPPHTDVVYQ